MRMRVIIISSKIMIVTGSGCSGQVQESFKSQSRAETGKDCRSNIGYHHLSCHGFDKAFFYILFLFYCGFLYVLLGSSSTILIINVSMIV